MFSTTTGSGGLSKHAPICSTTRTLNSWRFLLWFSILFLNSVNTYYVDAKEDVCLMMYQMADNNLEYFIRDDNEELIDSCAIRKKSLTTWVYFDARSQTGSQEDIWEPLADLYNPDGSRVSTKYTGSQYLTYNHNMKKMIVDTRLGELNGDNPQTVFDFVQHAMLDCISNGATEYILIFSSHGGGFHGFGGDEDLYRNRQLEEREHQHRRNYQHRHLTQANWSIRNALQQVLEKTPGAPSKFDVLGFDACLMSSLTAYAEFSSLTAYYIASEATEPGHGWAYKPLCAVDSALDLAKDIHDNFLTQRQGLSHQAPKTLALMESTNFGKFLTAMENLADELANLLRADNDVDFFALLQRSRASSISFDSILDNPGTEAPSAIDIGSFFDNFDFQCNPKSNSVLRSYLDEAKSAYDAMFVRRGNGPGTADATGMHVIWPFKRTYKSDKYFIDEILFGDENVVKVAPKWFTFLVAYLSSGTPSFTTATSVCSKSATGGSSSGGSGGTVPPDKDALFYYPKLYQQASQLIVVSDISVKVDYVFTEYGIDGSEYLDADRYRGTGGTRQLGEAAASTESTRTTNNALRSLYHRIQKSQEKTTPSGSYKNKMMPRNNDNDKNDVTTKRRNLDREWRRTAGSHARHGRIHSSNRKTLAENYLILYGGSLGGSFDGSSYRAVWDKKFYAIGDIDNFTPIYMRDEGGSSFSIPVFYFPNNIEVTSSMFDYDTTPEEVADMGGIYGALEFGINEGANTITAFTLMTSAGEQVSETPPSAGGHIVPILYVEGEVENREYWEIIGGVDGTVLDWNEEQDFELFVMSAEQYWGIYGLQDSEVVIDMWAFDLDVFDADSKEGFEMHSFYINTYGSSASTALKSHWMVSLVFITGVLSVVIPSFCF